MKYPRLPTWALACAMLAGCTAHYPVNEPVSPASAGSAGASHGVSHQSRSSSLLVGLAFSGGGTRAAAFAYGVLETLADTRIRWEGREVRLLDEVDVISSVSGGSFTSAYYGLFGDRIFEDYADKFLYQDVQGHLTWSLLSPANWFTLGSSKYDRSDLAADYYDEILFEGKTFGDVQARNAPIININATEIALGMQFTFDPAQFALICSDYASFPVSRAVTASSAVPIVFSTVVLHNYAGTCPFEMPPWVKAAQASGATPSRAAHLARKMAKYADRESKPYIHLYDGGLSDNLGVRPMINRISLAGGSWQLAKAMGAADTHRMVVVVVNAQSELSDEFQKSDLGLSLSDAISASSSVPLNEYSYESLALLRLAFEGLSAQIVKQRCKEWAETRQSTDGCDDFEVHLVEVDFDKLTDEKESARLKRLPTSFSLTVEEVDALRAAAREIMTGSADFQEFLRDVNGRVTPAAKD